MNPPTLKLELTVHEINQIAEVVKNAWTSERYNIRDDLKGYAAYNGDPEVVTGYAVRTATKSVETCNRLAALVYRLTGETLEIGDDRLAVLTEAQLKLALQEAAEKAEKEEA